VKTAEATGALPTFRWPVRGRVVTGSRAKTNGKSTDGSNVAVPDGTPVTAGDVAWTFKTLMAKGRPSVRVAYVDVQDAVAERDVSMVFQSYALFPHMTVLENVCYGLRASGIRKAQAVELAQARLALVGLAGYGVLPLVLGDLKPDYVDLITALGGQVITLGRGRGYLNILDPGEATAAARG